MISYAYLLPTGSHTSELKKWNNKKNIICGARKDHNRIARVNTQNKSTQRNDNDWVEARYAEIGFHPDLKCFVEFEQFETICTRTQTAVRKTVM